jgi:glycogen debranching enzyme
MKTTRTNHKPAHKERTLGTRSKPPSPKENHQRKQRLLRHGATALVPSIAEAMVLKSGDLFFLCERDGRVPLQDHHGLGLYYHDCRFLKGYELKIGDILPDALASTVYQGYAGLFDLTNPDIHLPNDHLIRKEQLGIKWERTVNRAENALSDLFTFQNFGLEKVEFPIALSFRADFEDIFQVRGIEPEVRGKLHRPSWKKGVLHFSYDGADHIFRGLAVYFSRQPDTMEGETARFRITLEPRASLSMAVSVVVAESTDETAIQPQAQFQPDLGKLQPALEHESMEWLNQHTVIESDSLLLNSILERSRRDLQLLQSEIGHEEFFAAGIPWFATLFGRDSLITALQTLALNPDIAAQTLRVLAHYQGQKVNERRDEEPGKILHELRVGEMAHQNEIPQTPYYGSVDATPLFLILVGRHAAWTGDLSLFHELRDNIERALEWISKYGDSNRDGYVEYETKSAGGLSNQGWKDSHDGIVNADGSLAKPPIALVEVQGYIYLAKTQLAELYQRAGESDRAIQLQREAEDLQTRFNRDFWVSDLGFFALALQRGGEPAAVVSSNPGQALWTGIVHRSKSKQIVERLMAPEMFNDWGIRTLATDQVRYSPIGYHLGTVWPHDNSIIAAGLRRYGFDDEAARLFNGMIQAAIGFPLYRLPELFAGFPQKEYGVPVRYPVACHPQAWAAGTMLFSMETMLGLYPEAFQRRLRIVRPLLPRFVQQVDVRRLRVGSAQVDLHYELSQDGTVAVSVRKIDGPLNVEVEPGTAV